MRDKRIEAWRWMAAWAARNDKPEKANEYKHMIVMPEKAMLNPRRINTGAAS